MCIFELRVVSDSEAMDYMLDMDCGSDKRRSSAACPVELIHPQRHSLEEYQGASTGSSTRKSSRSSRGQEGSLLLTPHQMLCASSLGIRTHLALGFNVATCKLKFWIQATAHHAVPNPVRMSTHLTPSLCSFPPPPPTCLPPTPDWRSASQGSVDGALVSATERVGLLGN